jgi:neuron navigator 2
MRQTIELLRKQSINAGLTGAHMQSMGVQVNGRATPNSPNKTMQQPQKQSAETTQFNGNHRGELQNGNGPQMQRHLSTDSMCSLNSISSGCSSQDKAKKKKGWVRLIIKIPHKDQV